MSYSKKLEARVKSDIAKSLAEHTVTELHSHGMYRHWRCQTPGTWHMGFDIVTWPGSLCYTGDMGYYLFQRTDDMVSFMRRSCMSYSYAAEKCVAHDGRLEEWRKEVFEEVLKDRLDESKEDGGTFTVMVRGRWEERSVAEAIEEVRHEYSLYESEHEAIKAMHESGLWDGGDLPSCKAYTYHFLWCLHATKWFCERIAEPVQTAH